MYLHFFHFLDSHTILVFLCQTLWQYSDGNPPPLTGASNAGGVGTNRDSQPISSYRIRSVTAGRASKKCDVDGAVYRTDGDASVNLVYHIGCCMDDHDEEKRTERRN